MLRRRKSTDLNDVALIEVRRAESADVSSITSVLREASQWLLSKGIDMWDRRDFSDERTSSQVLLGEYWIGEQFEEVVGVFRLLWDDPRVWRESPGEAGYVHNLAVAPGFHGQGMGRILLDRAEALIEGEGRSRARLDCVLGNERLRSYYSEAGYRLVGERLDERYNAWLFEKGLGT